MVERGNLQPRIAIFTKGHKASFINVRLQVNVVSTFVCHRDLAALPFACFMAVVVAQIQAGVGG